MSQNSPNLIAGHKSRGAQSPTRSDSWLNLCDRNSWFWMWKVLSVGFSKIHWLISNWKSKKLQTNVVVGFWLLALIKQIIKGSHFKFIHDKFTILTNLNFNHLPHTLPFLVAVKASCLFRLASKVTFKNLRNRNNQLWNSLN